MPRLTIESDNGDTGPATDLTCICQFFWAGGKRAFSFDVMTWWCSHQDQGELGRDAQTFASLHLGLVTSFLVPYGKGQSDLTGFSWEGSAGWKGQQISFPKALVDPERGFILY